MSGGHFDYKQDHIEDIAYEIQKELDNQGKEKASAHYPNNEEYFKKYPDEKYYPTYPKEIQEKFKEAIKILRIAAVYAKRIDYLLSGDDVEESFLEQLKDDLTKLHGQ